MSIQDIKPNKPLKQVVFELTYNSENWDMLYFSDFYDKVKHNFPEKQTQKHTILPIAISVDADKIGFEGNGSQSIDILQCSNIDKNVDIRFGHGVLTVNITPPYAGWDICKKMLLEIFAINKAVAKPLQLTKINLRYRNKINIPDGHTIANIKKIFNLYPNTAHEYIQQKTAINMINELHFEDNKSFLVLQQATLRSEENAEYPILLDLNYLCLNAGEINTEKAFANWLEVAHNTIYDVFCSTLTAEYKQLSGIN